MSLALALMLGASIGLVFGALLAFALDPDRDRYRYRRRRRRPWWRADVPADGSPHDRARARALGFPPSSGAPGPGRDH